jgi:hypothetical protein
LYCSVVATLFHFGGEFVGVVLILSEEVGGKVGERERCDGEDLRVVGRLCCQL